MTCIDKGDWSRVWVSGVRLAIRGTGTPTVAPPTLAEEYFYPYPQHGAQTALSVCACAGTKNTSFEHFN